MTNRLVAVDDVVIRRVLLDACEAQGELTFFEGQLFDGIGVETNASGSRFEGELRLWRYSEGRRGERYVEPFFGGDQDLIVNERAIPYNESGFELLLADERPLTGLSARTSSTSLLSLSEVVEGLPSNNRVTWHEDGSVKSLSTLAMEDTDSGLLQVQRYEERHDGYSENATWLTRLGLALGSDGGVGAGPIHQAHTFETFPPQDQRWFAASCEVQFDSGQKVQLINMSGSGLFEFLEQHTVDPAPTRWLPSSFADLASFGLSPQLGLVMDSTCLTDLIDGFGPEAFASVRDVEVATYRLEPDDILPLLELLPKLRQLSILEQAKPEAERGIRQLCRDLKTRRSNVKIMLDGREIYPNGATGRTFSC